MGRSAPECPAPDPNPLELLRARAHAELAAARMARLDAFAAAALTGILSGPADGVDDDGWLDRVRAIAGTAWEIAVEMERQRGPIADQGAAGELEEVTR